MSNSHSIEGAFNAKDSLREAAHRSLMTPERPEPRRQPMSGTFKGWVWVDEVTPGLSASACDIVPLSDATMSHRMERSATVIFLLNGTNGHFRAEGEQGVSSRKERPHVIGLGEARLCTRELCAGQICTRVAVKVKPDFLTANSHALVEADLDVLGQWLRPGFRSHHLPRCETIVQMARMLVEERYHGSLGKLFCETIATQLLLQSLRLFRQDRASRVELGGRCHDAVIEARRILDEALLEPPGMIELSRLVGVNRNALQAGFKAAFGTTVFGYVRDRRMAMARVMIEEQGLGAAEAGYRVGFSSPSAFSAAYHRTFGQPPMQGTRSRTT